MYSRVHNPIAFVKRTLIKYTTCWLVSEATVSYIHYWSEWKPTEVRGNLHLFQRTSFKSLFYGTCGRNRWAFGSSFPTLVVEKMSHWVCCSLPFIEAWKNASFPPSVELQIILMINQILCCAGKLLFTCFATVLCIRSTNIGIIPILFFIPTFLFYCGVNQAICHGWARWACSPQVSLQCNLIVICSMIIMWNTEFRSVIALWLNICFTIAHVCSMRGIPLEASCCSAKIEFLGCASMAWVGRPFQQSLKD